MIQNMNYASGDFVAGIAVASDALLSVRSDLVGGQLAAVLGHDYRPLKPPTPVRNPLSVPIDVSLEGWPDDPETELRDEPPKKDK